MVCYHIILEELERNEVAFTKMMNERECCSKILIEIENTLKELEKIQKIQLRELEITDQKIENKWTKKNELEKKLKNLDLKLSKTKDIIENANIITTIVVDDKGNYNLENGLVSANRDIVMKLVKMISDKTKIKNIIGMEETFYIWSKQTIFRWAREGHYNWLKIIKRWIGSENKFTPLYKASKDGFASKTFHEKCDNKGPTVTIITSSEGYVFGGYAAVSWNSDDDNVQDYSRQSFLFSLKNPRNTPPEKFGYNEYYYNMLFCSPDFGPCFNNELKITCEDHSNIHNHNYTGPAMGDFSTIHNLDGATVFTGQAHFRTREIEVYGISQD